MATKATVRQATQDWDEYIHQLLRSTVINNNETASEKENRIKRLEANPEEWFKYYFPNYCYAESAPFHKKGTKRILANMEWYETRAWSRELAKSARTMMEDFYLSMTGKKRSFLMVSNSNDNAVRLLKPYKINLEKNQRIINDYGKQQSYGSWTEGHFVTKKGVSFLAVGAGETPRGTRNEEIRPDKINVDDFDTDQDCRNPDIVDKKWEWFEKAVYPTRSISNPLQVVFNGNIIAEYCCIKKAMEMSDYSEVINIRDKNGKSTWPEKNKEEQIDRVTSKINYSSMMGEYYNTPITKGKVFKQLNYKQLRPLREYQFLVAYTDPSYKGSKKNDYKATFLVGRWKNEYHVLKVYCDQTSTANMLDWHFEIMEKYGSKIPVFHYIEWPTIDDAFKLELQNANVRHNKTLPLKADPRSKPDKFFRIEALLEPLNRNEQLWFDIAMKDSPMMKTAEDQFLALSPTSRAHDDAPDACEGAVFTINSKTSADLSKTETVKKTTRNDKRL